MGHKRHEIQAAFLLYRCPVPKPSCTCFGREAVPGCNVDEVELAVVIGAFRQAVTVFAWAKPNRTGLHSFGYHETAPQLSLRVSRKC